MGTLWKPIFGPLPMAPGAAQPASGASRDATLQPAAPKRKVRRFGSDTSWMLGLDERLLSSIVLKSLAMVSPVACRNGWLRAWRIALAEAVSPHHRM